MRRYETIVIIDPDLSEDDRTSLFTRIKDIIPQQQGVLIEEDLWGPRKLAYAIKKKQRGFYARYDYCGMGPLVDELERTLRIDDRSLKYLTVQLEEDADADKIQAEIAAAAEAASEQSAPAAPVAPTVDAPAPAPKATAETAAEAKAPEAATANSENTNATAETQVADPATETSEKE